GVRKPRQRRGDPRRLKEGGKKGGAKGGHRHIERLQEARAAEQEKRRAEYQEYLLSDKWRQRRALVLDRADGLCERCRQAPATQVHHLTYEHIFGELLFELVAVCDDCHSRAHFGDFDERE